MNETMSNDAFGAETGATPGVGALLREARERAGLSLEDVSRQVRMQVRMLQAIENEDWKRLGAPVFVRGQLRSYGRALKVDVEPFLDRIEIQGARPAEQLVSHAHTPRYQWLLEGAARRTMYAVLTAALVIPVWAVWNSSKSPANPEPQATASLDAIPAPVEPQQQAAAATPIAASMVPRPATPALQLRMNGDSWVQIVAPDGSTVEKGLIKAGEQRSYAAGQVGRMVIGNASEVEVQQSGSTVDTTPYRRSNVARFAVSSDGSLAPAAD